jgi:amino acid transporter
MDFHLSFISIIFLLTVIIVGIFWDVNFGRPLLPRGIPWIGVSKGLLAIPSARLASVFTFRKLLEQAYKEVLLLISTR